MMLESAICYETGYASILRPETGHSLSLSLCHQTEKLIQIEREYKIRHFVQFVRVRLNLSKTH